MEKIKSKEEVLKTRRRFVSVGGLGYYFEDEVLSAMEEYKNQSVVKPMTEKDWDDLYRKFCNAKGIKPFTINVLDELGIFDWLEAEFKERESFLLNSQEPKKSSLQELMNSVCEWSDATFGNGQRTIPILFHLKKEVDELIEAVRQDERMEGEFNISALKEFADAFMLLIDACNHHGFTAENLMTATKGKLEINKQRKWGNPDENGVVEHIKDSQEPKQERGEDK